ncbi:MAG: bifunctional folylpolyglutamate synthase/dihydrofolate synthase [Candidatus Coatesbacteria bacterium]|nr:bifunctional folylpolyglutamate synthase/dihydrofolate synthase [Candidatus Coatesbacteria bacterium]
MISYVKFLKDIFKLHASLGIKLNLDRMNAALDAINHPEKAFKSILIAGTNGKGSTTAYVERIFRYHGFKTGRLTSPHIIDYRERIIANGSRISEEEIIALYTEFKKIIELYKLTFFELTTLLAFIYFKRKEIDWAILEIGLGGRLDATNTVNPSGSIITNIGIDHEKSLGNTLKKIAYEKAGIIKRDSKVFLGNMKPDIETVFLERARDIFADSLFILNNEISYETTKISMEGTEFSFSLKDDRKINAKLKMIGYHQITNALLALLASSRLIEDFNMDKALEALHDTVWHARFERISEKPEIWLDVGHNLHGIKEIDSTLKSIFKNTELYILLAALRDKKIENMVKHLQKYAAFIALAPPESDRAPDVERLHNISSKIGTENMVCKNVTQAIIKLLKMNKEKERPILIIGSLFTAAEVYRYFKIKPDD